MSDTFQTPMPIAAAAILGAGLTAKTGNLILGIVFATAAFVFFSEDINTMWIVIATVTVALIFIADPGSLNGITQNLSTQVGGP